MSKTSEFTIPPWASYLVMGLLALVFLYDPDGAQYGMSFYEAGGAFVALMGLLGNLVWLLGIVLLMGVAGIIVGLMARTNDEYFDKLVDHTAKLSLSSSKYGDPANFVTKQRDKVTRVITVIIGLIGMASGFWWTGTLYFAMAIMMAYHADTLNSLIRKIITADDFEQTRERVRLEMEAEEAAKN